ncbi:type II secretion system minor pseudopilin GspI [Sphingomonas sp. CFBP 13720]|jgi:general secretion pathway protein I|uniref:type II secretion system minor pseudopilin GspI n=1 Tax=Sphingomonas sp. CFBP 13720 TaxID=2775302 RepID=UPI0017812964|nr:type II secretion system minor pseudopilin GspI [Sphingomonas sp. CFBP 13720]MBD8678176.1 type II secretion system minor pseudopilin GspI [Sphingomonas sp. CFBP 13720]
MTSFGTVDDPAHGGPSTGRPPRHVPPEAATPLGRCCGDGESNAGFSLIEAMVALAVLAIATVGLMGAVEQHIDSTRGVERRAIAMWVAENRLADLEVGTPEANGDRVDMLGRNWTVAVRRIATSDPALDRVTIEVAATGETAPLARLDGFLRGDGA